MCSVMYNSFADFTKLQLCCVTLAYHRGMSELGLSQSYIKAIMNTPFGHFYNMPRCRVSTIHLDDIVSRYMKGNKFMIAGKELEFTIHNVVEILDLPKGDMEIVGTKENEETREREKMFETQLSIQRNDILSNLKDAITE